MICHSFSKDVDCLLKHGLKHTNRYLNLLDASNINDLQWNHFSFSCCPSHPKNLVCFLTCILEKRVHICNAKFIPLQGSKLTFFLRSQLATKKKHLVANFIKKFDDTKPDFKYFKVSNLCRAAWPHQIPSQYTPASRHYSSEVH